MPRGEKQGRKEKDRSGGKKLRREKKHAEENEKACRNERRGSVRDALVWRREIERGG